MKRGLITKRDNFNDRIFTFRYRELVDLFALGGRVLGILLLNVFNISAHKTVVTAVVCGLIIVVPGSPMTVFTSSSLVDAFRESIDLFDIIGVAFIFSLTVLITFLADAFGGQKRRGIRHFFIYR